MTYFAAGQLLKRLNKGYSLAVDVIRAMQSNNNCGVVGVLQEATSESRLVWKDPQHEGFRWFQYIRVRPYTVYSKNELMRPATKLN